MRKLALAFVILIMIAGGVVSALKTFELGPFAKSEEEIASEATAGAEKKEKLSAFAARPFYVEMDPLLVPVFQDNELAGTIQIIYKLEVKGNDNFKSVEKLKIKLADAVLKDFSYYIPRTLRNNQNLDVSLIKYRIKMVADRIIGKDVISDALVQGMTQTAPGGG